MGWPLIFALATVALALAVYRSDALWCGGRALPLATFWRVPGFSYEQMPALHGKVVLVTGANTGLGLEVASQCARAGATVLLGCRDEGRCAKAAQHIAQSTGVPPSQVKPVRLDLNDLSQVDLAADVLLRTLDALHILINNAGIATQFPQPALSVDGIETTFQSNYLGHFHLTTKLLPLLERTAMNTGQRARVVHLSSGAHRAAPSAGVPLSLEGINDESIGPMTRYGMAKLASLILSNELARRHPNTILSNAVHPGVVATSMLRQENFRAMLGPIAGPVAWRAAKLRNMLVAYSTSTAALTVLFCACALRLEDGAGKSGAFFVPIATEWAPRHPKATDSDFGIRFWEFSHKLVNQSLNVDLAEAPMVGVIRSGAKARQRPSRSGS